MANIHIVLKEKSKIVLFHFLYSLHQHLGWPRSNSKKPEEITIFTTDDLIVENKIILNSIKKIVLFDLFEKN